MKKILISSCILSFAFGIGCNKNNASECRANGGYSGPVQIIKNCTGAYIRYLGKDYRVCNDELLKYYADGSQASVTFSPAGDCSQGDRYLCNMYYFYEETVTISCIR